MATLDQWVEEQTRRATAGMLMSVSPVSLVKSRPGFGQTMQPRKGAIVASPVLASYDPDPDYFFHWYRDSAVVVDALRLLVEQGGDGPAARAHLADFVAFSLGLQAADGRAMVADPSWRARAAPGFVQYLRSDADLAGVHGAAVAADTRVNPDGTLDLSRWNRPQHDGPPLRALALLRWLRSPRAGIAPGSALAQAAGALVRADLAFTHERSAQPSYDIWEEEIGLHYYTLRVSSAALLEGADWLAAGGEYAAAQPLRAQAQALLRTLDGYWLPQQGHYRSRVLADGRRSTKELDIAVILAAVHAAADTAADAAAATVAGTPADAPAAATADTRAPAQADTAHGPHDPRQHATLLRLEALFDATYALNRRRAADTGPALGRYAGDVYYSGGAYYFSTLGAAEFCFRAARGSRASADWIARGDAYLRMVRAHTPADGALSEQFDQDSGAQTSARHLAWSYAAFISCGAARRATGVTG